MCLGEDSFDGLGGVFRNEWKYLVNCLGEIFSSVSSINSSMVTPADTHLQKRLKYLIF